MFASKSPARNVIDNCRTPHSSTQYPGYVGAEGIGRNNGIREFSLANLYNRVPAVSSLLFPEIHLWHRGREGIGTNVNDASSLFYNLVYPVDNILFRLLTAVGIKRVGGYIQEYPSPEGRDKSISSPLAR